MIHEPEAFTALSDAFDDAQAAEDAARLPALTGFDRCDAPDCSAQAYLRARLPSGRSLVFCGHHGHDLLPALAGQGADIRDDTPLLAVDRSSGPTTA
jgi:hypothetical protein